MEFPKNIKCVIFDLDGTLANFPIDYDSMRGELNNTISKFNLHSDFKPLIPKIRDVANKIGNKKVLKDLFSIVDKYETSSVASSSIVKPIFKLYNKSFKKKLKVIILTRNSSKMVIKFLEKYNSKRPDLICSRDDSLFVKPHINHFDCIKKKYNFKKNEYLLIGDSYHDKQFARKLRIKFIDVKSIIKPKIKKKIMFIGIAGTSKDFLLSLHTLKCFLYQKGYIRDNLEIILKQYYYISPEFIKKKCKDILKEIEKIKPEMVCFSCYVWNIEIIKLISNNLKQKHKDIDIVFGGPEITREGIINGKFNNFKIDFLIFGEGEKPFLQLLKSIIESNKNRFQKIKGLAYKKSGSFFCNKESDFIKDISGLPSPYLEGYVSDEIFSRPEIRANIETQRGCNFRCAYCFYHKDFPKIRYRDINTVINEIRYVNKKGVKIGRILDANFLSNRDFAKQIIKGLIKHKVKMSLFFEILPQFIDEKISSLFGEYVKISSENRITVGIGLQTTNQNALAVIRRKIPLKYFENAFNLLQKQGVIIKSDIILGLPCETKKTYFETIEYISEKMRHGKNYLSLALLRILPGSDLIEIAKKENLKFDMRDESHSVYATPTLCRADMIECLRINAVAFRLLSSIDMENRMKLRGIYFDVKDSLGVTNIQMLKYFIDPFFKFLKNKNVDYVKDDFPNAENYSCCNVFEDIPDKWLIKKFKYLKKWGLKEE